MRIAIPTSDGKLDHHFGHCKQFTIVDVQSGLAQRILTLFAPPHTPGQLPIWLAEKHVTHVIAGGIGRKAIDKLNHMGIEVHIGAPKLSPEELVSGFLEDSLEFSSNHCDHGNHSCH
jgi:predicted Fe-Mo cluster-binding NifX family protein